jgi:hypothetical protein
VKKKAKGWVSELLQMDPEVKKAIVEAMKLTEERQRVDAMAASLDVVLL